MKIKETDFLTKVAEFHSLFEVPILEKPQIISEERANLRYNLLKEELEELREGIENKDIVEIADALCDLQYVLAGAALEFGLTHKFADLFNEAHRSNMSKACKTEEEVQATIKDYQEKGTEAYYQKKDNFFILYRTSDDKILKSINYLPADFEGGLF